MRRRNVPCSPCSGGSSGSCDCCGIKEKLRILWDRTFGSILRINGISPDGDGDFSIEAGNNILLTERGTGNGIRIDTTGAVSYYSSGDSYVNVDNNDLEITLNVGTGGLATDTDLQTVAGAVSNILDGTTTVPKASNDANGNPILARDAIGNLTDGDSLVWDNVNQKAITQSIPSAISTALAGKQATLTYNYSTATINGCLIRTETYGKMIVISCQGGNPTATGDFEIGSGFTNNPFGLVPIVSGNDGVNPIKGYLFGLSGKLYARFNASGSLDVGFRFAGIIN